MMAVQLRLAVLTTCIAGFTLASATGLRVPSFNHTYDLRRHGPGKCDGHVQYNDWHYGLGCLPRIEKIWINNIKEHISNILFYIKILEREFETFFYSTSNIQDKKQYLGTPTSLFSLLRRVARDWPKVIRVMSSLPGTFNLFSNSSNFSTMHHNLTKSLPAIVDLKTGYHALLRLHRVYNVSSTSVANLDTPLRDSRFSAEDYLEAASYFCSKDSFQQCQEWLEKSIEKMNYSPYPEISKQDFNELYFISHCLNGDLNISEAIHEGLLEENSAFTPSLKSNKRLDQIIRYGCEAVKERRSKQVLRWRKQLNPDKGGPNSRYIAWDIASPSDPTLLDLCRHRTVYTPTEHLLKCRYVHYNNPYLRIGPFKMEEFHIDPPVLMFHDVISDSEIGELVKFAEPTMKKATVTSVNDGTQYVNVDFRTNYQGWVEDYEHPLASVLSQRAANMTGWNLKHSEANQLACYGPGGEFVPHVDALFDSTLDLAFADYSVVMFYINDVVLGGHTIFPALNVSLVPQRGSAAIWFNRRPDGYPDMDSVHGGCPVLQGYKWVINKWFHKTTQYFPKCKENMETSFRYFYL